MHYDIIVEVVLQELSALVPSVSVEYSKDLYFGPVCDFGLFHLWLNHVQDDRNPVFICLAHSADIGVGSKTSNTAESF